MVILSNNNKKELKELMHVYIFSDWRRYIKEVQEQASVSNGRSEYIIEKNIIQLNHCLWGTGWCTLVSSADWCPSIRQRETLRKEKCYYSFHISWDVK